MAKVKLLQDLYRFPGFVPHSRVRGVFGDSLAVVITLQRRRKKHSVASAAKPIAAITTSDPDGSAISPAATNVSTWPSPCAASSVPGATA